ncbi:hypothetical protein K0M31_005044, partial [Melipona bicolor]
MEEGNEDEWWKGERAVTLHSEVFHFNGPPGDWLTLLQVPSPFQHNGPLHYLFVLANVLPEATAARFHVLPFPRSRMSLTRKVWIGDNEVAWRTEQSFKRTSPLISCTITTTTTTTGGGAPAHPHLSPPIAAPVTTPDHRTPSSLHVKLGISPANSSQLKLRENCVDDVWIGTFDSWDSAEGSQVLGKTIEQI